MKCTKCGCPDFFVGIITDGDCGNPSCVLFRNGTVRGKVPAAHVKVEEQVGYAYVGDMPMMSYVFPSVPFVQKWRDLYPSEGHVIQRVRLDAGSFTWVEYKTGKSAIMRSDRRYEIRTTPPSYTHPGPYAILY